MTVDLGLTSTENINENIPNEKNVLVFILARRNN